MILIAKTIAGLEGVLEEELIALGAKETRKITRAVTFEGDRMLLYRANYACRTALRILRPVGTFAIQSQDDFYKNIHALEWETMIDPDQTLAVDAVVTSTVYTNSLFVAQRAKDAIVDRIREVKGRRPSVDLQNPSIRVNVHLNKDQCSVSLDSSGEPLFKRGYRVKAGEAPLNEVLAAGLVRLSGWKGESALLDPMCGSGTLVIEGAFAAGNYPGGYLRKDYAFMNWADFDTAVWNRVVHEENRKIRPVRATIAGSDRSRFAVQIARRNVKAAGLENLISIEKDTFEELTLPAREGTILMNPPYDERLKLEDSEAYYKSIGDTLKWKYTGYTAWIITGDLHAAKFIGLKASRKIPVFNGPIECRFLRFDLFRGSHKEYKTAIKD